MLWIHVVPFEKECLRNRSGGLYYNKGAVSTSDRKVAAIEQSGGHAKNQVQVLVTISVIALTKGIKACKH